MSSSTFKLASPLTSIATAVLLTIFLSTIAKAENFKVGVMLPLTGDFAEFGDNARKGAMLAAEYLGDKFPDDNIKLIFEDEQCKAKVAVSAFEKITTLDKVDIIVGPACTGSILAVAPSAKRKKQTLIALLDTGRQVQQAGETVYSLGMSSEEEAFRIAETLREKGFSRTAILVETDEWAIRIKDAFERKYKELGGTIVSQEEQRTDAKDYRPALTRTIYKQPDSLFIVPAYDGSLVLKQLRSLGSTLPVFGPDTFANQTILELADGIAEGTIFANVAFNESSAEMLSFLSRYKIRFNENPSSVFYAALGYDGVLAAFRALKKGPKLQESLDGLRLSGVLGEIKFDSSRMAKLPVAVFQIRNAKAIEISK